MTDDEIDQEYREQLRQQRRKMRITFIVLGAVLFAPMLFCAGPNVWRMWQHHRAQQLTDAEREELGKLLDRAEADAHARIEAWNAAAVRSKLEAAELSEQGCPVSLEAPTAGAAKSYIDLGSIDGNYFGSWSLRKVGSGEAIGGCSSCAWDLTNVDSERHRLDESESERDDLERLRRRSDDYEDDYEVVLLVTENSRPMAVADSFIPGRVAGRAYLYSARAGKFICGADVEAESSETVNAEYSYMEGNYLDKEMKRHGAFAAALERDLDVQLRRAVADGLVALDN